MGKRILHVASNVAHYDAPSHPTGLWPSELTHTYDLFAERGYQQRIVSPKGGVSLLESRALPFLSYVVVDGRLVTGQTPWSAKATAARVVALL